MNLARLNHILIPATRDGRERVRRSLVGRALAPLFWLFGALSDEGRVFAVLVLFVGTAGLSVDTTQIYVLFAMLVGLFAASLAGRLAFRLPRVAIAARAPRRVAVGEIATFELELHNDGDAPLHDVRLAGPFLPWDGRYLGAPQAVAVVPVGGSARVVARAAFVARGEHRLDPFTAARLTPGGLAVGPALESESVRFLVVPRLARVEGLTLPLDRHRDPGGELAPGRSGDAHELVGVRPYRRGDPLRDLHAKTWARRGTPHVREYRHARSVRVGVALDDDPETASEAAHEAALSVLAGAIAELSRGEAALEGLLLHGEVHPLAGGRGASALDAALDRLATSQRRTPPPTDAWFAAEEPWLERLSALVVVSTASDARRRELLAGLARRKLPVRLLRVVDDRRPFGSKPLPAPIAVEERVLGVRALERQGVVLP